METNLLETMFGRMGARVKLRPAVGREASTGIDIRSDRYGEFFDIAVATTDRVKFEVVDLRPGVRHLLLLARRDDGKQKFLCGHDERHWFVCGVPGDSVANVTAAMEALQPAPVRLAVNRRVKRAKNRLRRRNEAFTRQGEWFFMPAPALVVNPKLILKNEPIRRSNGGQAHMCQYAYREGGTLVYVCSRRPRGLTEAQYSALLNRDSRARTWGWTRMRRDAAVFVKGRVWHPDHKTVVLEGWHRVVMNTEGQAPGARSVVFLD